MAEEQELLSFSTIHIEVSRQPNQLLVWSLEKGHLVARIPAAGRVPRPAIPLGVPMFWYGPEGWVMAHFCEDGIPLDRLTMLNAAKHYHKMLSEAIMNIEFQMNTFHFFGGLF